MAGEWIKMRIDLGDDPSVVKIASLLGITEDEVVGKLHRLWSWADRHTHDGQAPGITQPWVDRYVAKAGFAEAMQLAGWLVFTEDGISFPRFDRHNGRTAKNRADAAIRQRLSRSDRDKGVTGSSRDIIPRPFRRHVFDRDAYRCVFCGTASSRQREDSGRGVLSIDHLTPNSRGGRTIVPNLCVCCQLCNNEKNDRTPEEWGILPTFLCEGVTYVDGLLRDDRDGTVTDPSTPVMERREEKSKNKKPPLPPIPGSIDTPEFREAWARWQSHRKEKRKPLTPTSVAQQFRQFVAWGVAYSIEVIDYTITKGWEGLREPDPPRNGFHGGDIKGTMADLFTREGLS